MAEKDRGQDMAEEAFETGRYGAPSPIENEAFTLQGQGPETAQREREVREQLRTDAFAAGRDPEYGKGSRKSPAKKPTSSSGSGSGSTSSSSS